MPDQAKPDILGTVGIRRLKIHTIVGLLPHERITPQDIFLSLEMKVDFRQCHQQGIEDLQFSVDYASVAQDLTTWIQQSQFELLESIVLLGTMRILERHPAVFSCKMEIEKPAAIETAAGAFVSWTETRD